MKKNVLILCTGNSCRSQIAHGYFANMAGDHINVYSAGVETHGVNPTAIKVMKEDDIDISQHTSNHIDEYANVSFDFVITVCDNARERCPYFPTQAIKLHHNFPDPAKTNGSEEEILYEFRKVRDLIKDYIKAFISDYKLS